MAFITFLKSMAPASPGGGFGKTSKPGISIAGNGRILLTRAASEVLAGCKAVSIAWDEATRRVVFVGAVDVPKGKEDAYIAINWPKQGSQSAGLAGTGLLRFVKYDFKAAGNQCFAATVDVKKRQVIVQLPAETPTPKPVAHRTRKSNGKAPDPAAVTAPPAEGEFATA